MATKCPKCHSENPDTLKFCGECGTQLPSLKDVPREFTETLKTPINSEAWLGALQGKQEALDYILDHNIRDVTELRNNYNKLIKFDRKSGVSI